MWTTHQCDRFDTFDKLNWFFQGQDAWPPMCVVCVCATPLNVYAPACSSSRRELKDALAKGVSDSDFRVYEREQAVRRELEGALARLGGQVEGLVAEKERVSHQDPDPCSSQNVSILSSEHGLVVQRGTASTGRWFCEHTAPVRPIQQLLL